MEQRAGQDATLVDAALRGDRQAFGELVVRYQRLVAGVAWRAGVPGAEVDDVVSEVFIKAYRNLQRFRPDHPFSTWLYRVALNHVIDLGRRRGKERRRVEMPPDLADTSPDAATRAETSERAFLLRAALRELKPRHREALFLVYVEGLRVEDAARLLALPSGTLKTRLMRGRDALRRLLVERHPDYFESRT